MVKEPSGPFPVRANPPFKRRDDVLDRRPDRERLLVRSAGLPRPHGN